MFFDLASGLFTFSNCGASQGQRRDEVRTLVPTRMDDKGRYEQRSMRLNDVFDNFRREIEVAMNPWSSMLDWRFRTAAFSIFLSTNNEVVLHVRVEILVRMSMGYENKTFYISIYSIQSNIFIRMIIVTTYSLIYQGE